MLRFSKSTSITLHSVRNANAKIEPYANSMLLLRHRLLRIFRHRPRIPESEAILKLVYGTLIAKTCNLVLVRELNPQ
jgi:hypothetical protein